MDTRAPLPGRKLIARLLFAGAAFSLLLLGGCSSDPVEEANEYIAEANEAIDEHNQLYEESRATYEEARTAVEDGEDPSDQIERVTEARETLEDARATLAGGRDPLADVRNLDVDPEIGQYAALLSEAIDAQIAAEDQEMEFYQLLEEDPSLEDNREEAETLLTDIDAGYERAEDAYSRAQELADDNPELIQES